MKINFKDVTFVIPIRFDSEDRFFNFQHVVKFILENFTTNLIVLESDFVSHESYIKSVDPQIDYIFLPSNDGVFHRTKYLNVLYEHAKTDIVINYDADVFFPIHQYVLAKKKLDDGFDFCYPYDGRFFDLNREDLNRVYVDGEVKSDYVCNLLVQNSVGGAFFFKKSKYKLIGYENENFISWGSEDWERYVRIKKIGLTVCRIDGPLYHIHHVRSANSSSSNPFFDKNQLEFDKIDKMTRDELMSYVSTWQSIV